MNNKNSGKFIDFIITQKCTFKCPYCSQSKGFAKIKNDADDKTIQSFLKFLDSIEKDFEITVMGGEAILHPKFFDLISDIKNKGFKINLITNLSFEIEKYEAIFSLLQEQLNKFDISFHLGEIHDFNLMINKLNEIILKKPSKTVINFLIPIFELNAEKQNKIEIIRDIAQKNSIDVEFQHIRFLNQYRKNSQLENEYLENNIQKTYSKYCLAGCNSAIIYENGEAYRCYSSRFLKSNYLGNINDNNFSLNDEAFPCVQKICTCPKPKQYNQILTRKSKLKADIINLYNVIFFPYYIFKNFNIVKTKIKQLSSKWWH